MVHFVGYLRTEQSSSLKFNQRNMKKENEENENQIEWPNPNSLLNNSSNNTGKINGSSSVISNISAGSSSIPTLQHYLITCGKIKQMDEELVQNKFLTRHDADGKFIYLESRFVLFFICFSDLYNYLDQL